MGKQNHQNLSRKRNSKAQVRERKKLNIRERIKQNPFKKGAKIENKV